MSDKASKMRENRVGEGVSKTYGGENKVVRGGE